MKRFEEVVAYLAQITGDAPLLRALSVDTRKIPLYLRQLYELREIEIFGHPIVLAAITNDDAFTPAEMAKHHDLLQKIMPVHVALVLPETIPTYNRNRLIQQCVPFIVPKRQLHLPMLLVDLREGMLHRSEPRSQLSASAQVVVLYRLLHGPLETYTLAELAQILGYSAMTLTKAAQELDAYDWAQTVPQGRKIHLHFPVTGEKLWALAEPLLQSPVKQISWAAVEPGIALPFVAGISALARFSSLMPAALPVCALPSKRVQELLREKTLRRCADADEAQLELQEWRYDPAPLTQGECVDRLSLYLSLRDSNDERVRQALYEMMEIIEWRP